MNIDLRLRSPKINVVQSNESRTDVVVHISELQKGLANGYASSLRANLYQYIPGMAPIGFTLDGTANQMQNSALYREQTSQIARNIERAKVKVEGEPVKQLTLSFNNKVNGELTLGKFTSNVPVTILNPELVILSVPKETTVTVQITMMYGTGFIDEEKDLDISQLQTSAIYKDAFIRVNSRFNPVELATFTVLEDTPYPEAETLEFRIKTDGSIESLQALSMSATLASKLLEPLTSLYMVDWDSLPKESMKIKSKGIQDSPIEFLDLSPAVYNRLKELNINAIRDVKNKMGIIPEDLKLEIIRKLEELGLDQIENIE